MNNAILFDESLSSDTRLMKFAHECIRAFRGQEPPYDAMEVEFLVFSLRLALLAQRERDATVNVIDRKRVVGSPDYDAGWFDGVEACLDAIRNQP